MTDEHITDVTAGNHLVFAACFKEKVRVKINVYDERVSDWSLVRSIRTAIPGKVTLLMRDENLFACSMDQAIIYVLTIQGEVSNSLCSTY